MGMVTSSKSLAFQVSTASQQTQMAPSQLCMIQNTIARQQEQTLPMCGPPSHFTGMVDGSDNPVLPHISEEQAWSVSQMCKQGPPVYWKLMASLHDETLVGKKGQPGGELKLHLYL